MSPFTALGPKARWRVVYDLLVQVPVGSILTYQKMALALELNVTKDRHIMQVAMRRAAEEFLITDRHAVEAVQNQGYRVVEAPEHAHLANKHQRKSSKALVRGHKTITHVDVTALDPVTRKAFELVAASLGAQLDFSRRLDIRQRHLEKALGEIQNDHQATQERTKEELRTMRERLERLEAAQRQEE